MSSKPTTILSRHRGGKLLSALINDQTLSSTNALSCVQDEFDHTEHGPVVLFSSLYLNSPVCILFSRKAFLANIIHFSLHSVQRFLCPAIDYLVPFFCFSVNLV